MTETLPVHSPLGASSAERWMNCPGSVSLCKSVVGLAEPADPEYRKEGTAAHSAIAYCLSGSCPEPWEVIGDKFDGVEVTTEMADAIQVFIDKANALSADAQATYVEEHLNDPDNKYAYGTIDYGAVHPGLLAILDFKYGIGVRVETHGNMQMLYYAYLVLLKHPDVRKMLLTARAYAEGGRALSAYTVIQLDKELHHPDEEVRAEAADEVALLTPIIKATN